MKNYIELVEDIYNNGYEHSDRTGVGTKSLFGRQLRFDLSKGFPATTIKKLAFKSVVSELLWFLEGSTDERRLAEIHYKKPRETLIDKTTIWSANANEQGKSLGFLNNDLIKDLGAIYGYQWRYFGGSNVDQIKNVINQLNNDKESRRIVVSAWNPIDLNQMALPPCHYSFQFRVYGNKLNCLFNMRSCDAFLGLPFNIASYALLTHLIAHECNLELGDLVANLADVHLYNTHLDACKDMIDLFYEKGENPSPTLNIEYDKFDFNDILNGNTNIDIVKFINLNNYKYHREIKATMVV